MNIDELWVPYNGDDDPYVFLSYDHTHYDTIYPIYRLLRRQGIRVWFDDIGAGVRGRVDWDKFILNRLNSSSMFICFLANGIEYRPQVLKEIEWAIKKYDSDPNNYRVLFIYLEKMSLELFPDQIKEFLAAKHHIFYEGITDRFMYQLFYKSKSQKDPEMFSSSVVDNDIRRAFGLPTWDDREEKPNLLLDEIIYSEVNPYIHPYKFPEKRKDENFYRVSLSQIHPNSTYLMAMDNQWVPDELLQNPHFIDEGISNLVISKEQQNRQRKEFFQALLHHQQIILNRASLFNCKIFYEWYREESRDYKYFQKLIQNGSLLVYLLAEKTPNPSQKELGFSTNYYSEWKKFCEKNTIYCLRFDWDNDHNNTYLIQRHLGDSFQDFVLTFAEHPYQIEEFAERLLLEKDAIAGLKDKWREIQIQTASRIRKKVERLSRETFYENYIIKKNTKPVDCRIDYDKEYPLVLKLIIDFKYVENLAMALGTQLVIPENSFFHGFSSSPKNINSRKLGTDELLCAITDFNPTVLEGNLYIFNDSYLNLEDIVKFREMDEWKIYMKVIEAVTRRAKLNVIDIYDIQEVWNAYRIWTEKICDDKGESIVLLSKSPTITLVIGLGNSKVLISYRKDGNCEYLIEESKHKFDSNHIAPLIIDFIFNDMINDRSDDIFTVPLRLFEGITSEPIELIIGKIKERLETRGFVIKK